MVTLTESAPHVHPVSAEVPRQPFPLHPLLLGMFEVLRLYARNLAAIPIEHVVRPLVVSLAATCLVWAIAAGVLRDNRRGAAVASALLAFVSLFHKVETLGGLVLAGSLLILGCVLAGWKWRLPVTQFLNITSSVLFLMMAYQIGSRLYAVRSVFSGHPVPVLAPVVGGLEKPDIYYIILDGYGRSDALKKYIGYDDSDFVSGLRKRGFVVGTESRSNYSQTEQSLASSLNMDFLPKLLPREAEGDAARMRFDRLIDHNRVADVLRSHGYRFAAVTTGFDSVRPRSADVLFAHDEGLTLFESTLLNGTPFQRIGGTLSYQFAQRRARLKEAFADIRVADPGEEQPSFVFAHFLCPHPPFVIASNGDPIDKPLGIYGIWDGKTYYEMGGSPELYRKGYAGQAEWVGKQVLAAVDAILASHKTRPIIIIQGDHGSKTMLDDQSREHTDMREVFRNLNAYLVPDEVKSKLYPCITPVNSFRLVLSQVLDERLPLLPDRSYFSTWGEPSKFEDVTEEVEKPLDADKVLQALK